MRLVDAVHIPGVKEWMHPDPHQPGGERQDPAKSFRNVTTAS
jgi:hypothetical protein